jgi:hypothetical protein
MTITLPLEPQEEANLNALARAKGLSAEALVREALKGLLAGASSIPNGAPSEPATGAALVAAMQASPYKETDLQPARSPLRARDIVL